MRALLAVRAQAASNAGATHMPAALQAAALQPRPHAWQPCDCQPSCSGYVRGFATPGTASAQVSTCQQHLSDAANSPQLSQPRVQRRRPMRFAGS